ncbi:hypothetical protein [Thalassoroseus pseudoceratinae]|uniref:hypothetical protein n=1 Tax=Thalassoroseus pseudoceratinae TaxID=2713176 RepID=UPI0014207C3A|nr:hypothetical protein [Thalassoroseus pseudoceratinae]
MRDQLAGQQSMNMRIRSGFTLALLAGTIMTSAVTSISAQDSKKITLKRPVQDQAIADQDGGLQLTVPDGWTAELKEPQATPNSQDTILLQRFKTSEGLSVPVYLLAGGGAKVRSSVERWQDQFPKPPTGADVENTRQTRSAIISKDDPQDPSQKLAIRYVFVDITGNFKGASEPLLQHAGAIEDGRLLGAIIGVPDSGIYVITMVGSQDNVEAEFDAFRSSFGALPEDSENDIDLSPAPETSGGAE